MKKIIAIVLSLVFVFAVTSVTFAAEKKEAAPAAPAKKEVAAEKKEAAPAKKEAAPAKKAKSVQATGEVTAVDAKANTMTLKAKKGDVTVATDDKTKVMPKGKTAADVKVGDKVKVVYTEADGKNTAKSVTIMPAPKKAEKKEAAPAAEKKADKKEAAPAKKDAPAAAAPAAAPAKAAPAKKAAGY